MRSLNPPVTKNGGHTSFITPNHSFSYYTDNTRPSHDRDMSITFNH